MHDLDPVLAPIQRARGLPNAHYTDPDVHAVELERLFLGGWAGLCFASDVPEPGDAMPVDFAGQPLVAVHGKDGRIRVFENVCRHRGMILVPEKRRIGGALRCPYHSWCYATDGRLVATPHVGGPGRNTAPGINRATLGLTEVRAHVWRDVVFVDRSGTAPAFEVFAADLIARWADLDQPLHDAGPEGSFDLTPACNWKLAVENYSESYHLPWVHPGLNSYSRLEDHYHIEAPRRFAGQGTRVYRPPLDPTGRRFPDFAGVLPRWDTAAEYVALCPNVLLGVHRDQSFAILLLPDGQDRTRERIRLTYASAEVAGTEWAAMRATNAAMWKDVFVEDIFVVEGMQRGRAARGFDGGRFSPAMDGPVHLFHAWVAERMGARALADA